MKKFDDVPEINALRGSPPSDQIDAASDNYDAFIESLWGELRAEAGENVDNYGLDKYITKKLKETFRGLDVVREGEEVLFYQNTVNLVNGFIDQAVLEFQKNKLAGSDDLPDVEREKSSLVVIVESSCYDRVEKNLRDRVEAGQIRLEKCPFDFENGELDLNFLDNILGNGDVPIFYRTPVNNPTGLNTLHQDEVIYEWVKMHEGAVVSDYAYHFLSDKNTPENPMEAFAGATKYTDVCLGQFSKVTGQTTLSVGVFKEENPFASAYLSKHENGNFTDPDQRKIAYLYYLMDTDEGKALLYDFEQKGKEMVLEIRNLFEASSLSPCIAPEKNDGYFELVALAEDEAVAKDILKKANIKAGLVEVDGVWGARVSYSLDKKTISDLIQRLELVLDDLDLMVDLG